MESERDTNEIERRILAMMRKVLSSVARDTAPTPGRRNVLSDQTVQDIRECLSIISLREQQLAEQSGIHGRMKPRFTDQAGNSAVVPVDTIKHKKEN